MNALIVLLALCRIPTDLLVEDSCDYIEVNTVWQSCEREDREVFTQLIFWVWNRNEARYNVRDWRIVKSDSQRPTGQPPVVIWIDDRGNGTLRRVTCRFVVFTDTYHDPELRQRSVLPEERRVKLRIPPDPKHGKEVIP
jgi:hypothetical protein